MPARRSSPGSTSRFKVLCLLAPLMALGGCVDYLKRRDTMTLEAGDAQAWNKTVHTADPWPPYAMNNNIPGDGRRTAVVMQRYSTGNAGAAQASNSSEDSGAEKD